MPSTTRKVGARVVLDGEEDYKKAIESLNAGSRTLASELKRLQAEYKDNTDSVEFLTEKGDILVRQLDQQKAKTAEVREMLERASKAQAEALQRLAAAENEGEEARAKAAEELRKYNLKVEEFSTALDNAEAAEFNLQHAIEENDAAMKGENETMTGLGDTLDKLADKFGVRIPKEAKEALNGIEGLSAGMVAKMAAAAGAVAAVVKAVKELGEMTLKVAADVDDLLTESAITGVSTQMLQAWDYAAPLIDTDAETIKGAMVKITKAMGDARDGNDEMIERFQQLGVCITDDVTGELRSAEDVFWDVVDGLGEIENATERDITANDLLGKSYGNLTPLVKAGRSAMDDLYESAEAVGYILSEDQVAALAAVDDSYQELKLTVQALENQIAADFAPAAEAAMDLFSDVVREAGEWLKQSGLIENIASIVQSLVDIIESAGEMLTGLPGFTNALNGLKVVLGAIAQFVAVIADAADLLTSLLHADWSGVTNALGFGYSSGNANNLQRTRMQQEGTWQQYSDYYGNNATGNDNWRGGLTWVGENGPEIAALPAGTQIMSAQESRDFGGDTFYITIDAKSVEEFNEIVEICRNARVDRRMR